MQSLQSILSYPLQQNGFAALVQLMPILLILFLSLFSSFFASDPLYSLQQSRTYAIKKTTSNLRIHYYVKDSFHADFQVGIWMSRKICTIVVLKI
jgi:hypothetical protein